MNKLIRITTIPLSLEKLLGGGQMHFMNNYFRVIAVSSHKEKLEDVGSKEGVGTFHIDLTRRITPFKDLKALWKLFRFLRSEKPLIVHTHTPKAGTIGMIAAWLARVPIRMHTVAGMPLLEVTGKKRVILERVEKITYHCASRVYPNSLGLQQIIINNKFCRPEKLKVLAHGSSNGIDTSHFDPLKISSAQKSALRKDLGIEEKEFVFIFVGRLVTDKGIKEVVNAFDSAISKHIGVKLLLVGDMEPELDPLEAAVIRTIHNNINIISAGFQDDVRPYMAISDLLVFPSYREGFPNVVMQAGAMGVPAIVTDINGCNEIIQEGKNGTLIPVKNVEALQEKMDYFIQNPQQLKTLATNAREMIVSRYEQKMVWEAILAEYQKLEKSLPHV